MAIKEFSEFICNVILVTYSILDDYHVRPIQNMIEKINDVIEKERPPLYNEDLTLDDYPTDEVAKWRVKNSGELVDEMAKMKVKSDIIALCIYEENVKTMRM